MAVKQVKTNNWLYNLSLNSINSTKQLKTYGHNS